jgi:Cu2+-exporting ATPase
MSTVVDPEIPRAQTGERACKHCGLAVPPGDASGFCCDACETVYTLLTEEGLADTYYQLADTSRTRKRAQRTRVPIELEEELDGMEYLQMHARPAGDDGAYSTFLYLDGVHCAACVWLVERLPRDVEGVKDARLDVSRGRLRLIWYPEIVRLSVVAQRLHQIGYPLQRRTGQDGAQQQNEERALLIRIGVSWALAGNVMLLAWALYGGLDAASGSLRAAAVWLSLGLTTVSLAVGGSVFFKRAWASLAAAWRDRSLRHLHMDTPISIGILVGFLGSAWETIRGGEGIWFDSIAVLIAAVLTARWLQVRARARAGKSTDALLGLIPLRARVRRVNTDGSSTFERTTTTSLEAGAEVYVWPGELIPVDGAVHSGEGTLDRSVLTGESVAQAFSPGDAAYAGTRLLEGRLVLRAQACGDDTRVGSLIAQVRDAQVTPAPRSWVDTLAGWFVVAVGALAIGGGLVWWWIDPTQALHVVVSVLVISCPCALGMAVPLTHAIAMGRGARSGTFFKSESVFEQLRMVDTVLLDKTGTITRGTMVVRDHTGDWSEVQRLSYLEEGIEHPAARTIYGLRGGLRGDFTHVESVPGQGVFGRDARDAVFVGGSHMVPLPDDLNAQRASWHARGWTTIVFERSERVVAMVALEDELRSDAAAMVADLTSAGCTVYIASGDHQAVVDHLAPQVGIPTDRAWGGCSPEQKQALIEEFQRDGHRVLMVGDGVNDAVALKQADIGISVAGGSVASQLASDVFTTRPGLSSVHALYRAARQVRGRINTSVGISLAYNAIGALLALMGWITPLLAAILMPLSSIAVVLIALTQRTFR